MKIKISKTQWENIGIESGWMKTIKMAQYHSHAFDMFSEVSKTGIFKTEDLHYVADGLVGTVSYKDQKYQITIKTMDENKAPESPKESVESPEGI